MYIYRISQEHRDIAKAEIETLIGPVVSLDDNLFLVESYGPKAKKLAYTKQVYKILASGTDTQELLSSPIEDNYRFDAIGEETLPLADRLYALHQKKVSLEQYDHHYVLFSLETTYFTEEIYVNTDTGQERRAHQRAYNHPTSMHPLLAKAMINLSGATSFIDPFCGAGGILIEGAKMGYEVLGADISEEMIERAEQNLKALGYIAQLSVQDALTIESEYEAVVTDLPYGKNSVLESKELYDQFLEHAKNITSTLVLGSQQGSLTDLHGWTEAYRFPVYVHKSLTREILVLKKG
ncbi:MAG: methyltransferase domain-containing protein [Nanoarchaeota archaeon]|nr:methyltransferase domain-containing protein [Nanoarchaeota archaeon]